MNRPRLERVLAVVGATALLVAGFDTLTYATTGGSLILGAVNQANQTTRMQSAVNGSTLMVQKSGGIGAPLGLTVPTNRAATTPPLATNARGRVANLYAERAASADNAAKLGGLTASQLKAASRVRASIKIVTRSTSIDKDTVVALAASCPAGMVVTGGGYTDDSISDFVYGSYPSTAGNPGDVLPVMWIVKFYNPTTATHEVSTYATCVS